MKKTRIKTIIIPLVVIICLAVSIVLLYNFLLKSEIENSILKEYTNNIENRTEQIIDRIEYDKTIVSNFTEDNISEISKTDNSHYIDVLTEADVLDVDIFIKELSISKYSQLTNAGQSALKDEIVVAYPVTIASSKYLVIVKFIDYLNVFEANNINNYYLVDGGLGLIDTSESTKNNYLYDYFDGGLNSNQEIVDEILDSKKTTISVDKAGKKTSLYANNIIEDSSNKYYLIVEMSNYSNQKLYNSIELMTIICIATCFIIAIVGMIYLYAINQTITHNMLMSLRKISGSSTYAIVTDSYGKIKKMNAYVKEDFVNSMDAHRIEDLMEDNKEDLIQNISLLTNFSSRVKFENGYEYIRFYIASTSKGRIFIGEKYTEEYLNIKKLEQLVYQNPVTKRNNGVALKEKLRELVANNKQLANSFIIAIDILHFNSINRVFGREVADLVLSKIASTFEENFITNVFLYHVDSDNFYLLCEYNDEPRLYAQNMVDAIFELFKQPLRIYNNLIVLKLKMGIYIMNDSPRTENEVINNANMALRSAKSSRQQNYVFYDINIGRIITKEMQMQTDMIQAVKNKEFVLYYQPQYDLINKRVCGFEALIRWANPKYIGESPLTFIEMAEKNDQIIEIGRFVIEESFKTAKYYENENITISVNVSPVQLMQSGFVHEIIKTAERLKVNPQKIAIEITETVMMELYDDIIEKLRQLNKYGFEIHLDDFGTGYSSLLYLNNLPINVIKIDKEFIRNMSNESTRLIVTKVISMATGLNLGIIAEGVENDKESQFIEKAGCQIIQGYVISKAVPEKEIRDILDKYNNDDSPIIGRKPKGKEERK